MHPRKSAKCPERQSSNQSRHRSCCGGALLLNQSVPAMSRSREGPDREWTLMNANKRCARLELWMVEVQRNLSQHSRLLASIRGSTPLRCRAAGVPTLFLVIGSLEKMGTWEGSGAVWRKSDICFNMKMPPIFSQAFSVEREK